MPSCRVWLRCRRLVTDGWTHPAVLRIKACGTHERDQNIHKRLSELLSRLGFGSLITRVGVGSLTDVVLPSTMFAWLCRDHPARFKRCLGARDEGMLGFWTGYYNSPEGRKAWAANPYLVGKAPGDLKWHIPLHMHEDAGPFAKSRSTKAMFWGSFTSSGSDLETRFLYGARITDKDELDNCGAAYDLLFADLDNLFSGHIANMPIARCSTGPGVDDYVDWKGLMLHGFNDSQQGVEWGLPDYNAVCEKRMCGYCDANRGSKPFTDLRPTATWKPSELSLTNAEFVNATRGSTPHPLNRSRLWSKYFTRLDTMHCLDHRGVSGIVAGSVFSDLTVTRQELGATRAQRMAEIDRKKDVWFATHVVSSKMPKLFLKNIQFGGGSCWCELHGPLVKAANTRHLMPFVDALVREMYGERTDDWSVSTVVVCSNLCKVYDILYSSDMFLSADALAALKAALDLFGVHFMRLRSIAEVRGLMYFQLTPKVHFMQHIYLQCCLINSRFCTCYSQESMVGRITKIYKSNKNSRYRGTIQRSTLLRYLVFFACELEL